MRDHRMVLQRATRDGLTDLPNHRAFQDEFSRAVASAARYEDQLALALLDIDDFKLINDPTAIPMVTRYSSVWPRSSKRQGLGTGRTENRGR